MSLRLFFFQQEHVLPHPSPPPTRMEDKVYLDLVIKLVSLLLQEKDRFHIPYRLNGNSWKSIDIKEYGLLFLHELVNVPLELVPKRYLKMESFRTDLSEYCIVEIGSFLTLKEAHETYVKLKIRKGCRHFPIPSRNNRRKKMKLNSSKGGEKGQHGIGSASVCS